MSRTGCAPTVCALVLATELFGTTILQAGWRPLGLQGHQINAFDLLDGFLYAATNDGVYRLQVSGTDTAWTALGLEGEDVSSLKVLSADTILSGHESGTTSFHRTTDGGATWLPFQNNFGGGQFHPVLYLEQAEAQAGALYAAGISIIAKSTDLGGSWRTVWGDWSWLANGVVMVKADPYSARIMWAGGEGGFLNPWLLKSVDSGETWDFAPIPYDGDNRCHDIAIYPNNSEEAWVSMEGKVIHTTDGGLTWEIVFTNDYYLYRIRIDASRPSNLYMTGGTHSALPLTLFVSTDAGLAWQAEYESSHPTSWARDMMLTELSDRNLLYLGTTYGVYEYTHILQFSCGDADGSGEIAAGDIVFLVNYVFKGGPPPAPYKALADVNCSGSATSSDIIALVNFVFKSGTAPCTTCLSTVG